MDTVKLIDIEFHGQIQANEPVFEKLNPFSYEFQFSKSFLLDSDVGYGGWAISWIVAGLLEPDAGTLLRNNIPYMIQARKSEVWCVRKSEIKRFGLIGNQTVKWQIQHGLKNVSNQFLRTEAEFIDRFYLSPERYNRPFRYLSNEAWRASCAIGLANGKRVFCFPHMQYMRRDFNEESYQLFFKKIIEVLKEAGALILLPAKADGTIKNLCDEIVPILDT